MKHYSKLIFIAFLGIIGSILNALAFQTPQPEMSDAARVLAVLWTGRCQAFLKETGSKANGVITSKMIDGATACVARAKVTTRRPANYSGADPRAEPGVTTEKERQFNSAYDLKRVRVFDLLALDKLDEALDEINQLITSIEPAHLRQSAFFFGMTGSQHLVDLLSARAIVREALGDQKGAEVDLARMNDVFKSDPVYNAQVSYQLRRLNGQTETQYSDGGIPFSRVYRFTRGLLFARAGNARDALSELNEIDGSTDLTTSFGVIFPDGDISDAIPRVRDMRALLRSMLGVSSGSAEVTATSPVPESGTPVREQRPAAVDAPPSERHESSTTNAPSELSVSHSSDLPSMNGSWALNLAKSSLGADYRGMVQLLTIQQDGTNITIKTSYSWALAKDEGNGELQVRGNAATSVSHSTRFKNGQTVTNTGTAQWQAGALITVLKTGKTENNEKYEIVSNGRELIKTVTLNFGKRGFSQKYVYDRTSN